MHEPWFYLLWSVGSYLLGSLSAGDMVARSAGVEIRNLGTRNPGTANIYREVGAGRGILVFVLDAVKGGVATLPLYLLGLATWTRLMAGTAVLLGHVFPVPWRHLGGTGMAVGMGAAVGLLPLSAMAATPLSLLAILLTRSPAYSGTLFFLVTALAGGLLHRDLVAVAAVTLLGGGILVRAWLQYRKL